MYDNGSVRQNLIDENLKMTNDLLDNGIVSSPPFNVHPKFTAHSTHEHGGCTGEHRTSDKSAHSIQTVEGSIGQGGT